MVNQSILVVRLGAMGDVIHALPAVASLKQSFPHCQLTWVIEPKWASLLEANPFVDEVLTFRRTLQEVRSLRRELRRRRFDFAVDFQGLIKSALVASTARPDRIYGYHWTQARERFASLFYSSTLRAQATHVVDSNIELAQHAGATNVTHRFVIPEGHPEGDLPRGDFVLANPLAGWAAKQWPLERYSDLARRIRQEFGLPLVINDSRPLTVPETYSHVSGLSGLIHATRRAVAVVGVDSGPMHLAAALGKPGVAIFGPTDPIRNGPYGGSVSVLRSTSASTSYKRRPEIDDSMQQIEVDQVLAVLRTKLYCATNS
jgi:heptosyltransferase-1